MTFHPVIESFVLTIYISCEDILIGNLFYNYEFNTIEPSMLSLNKLYIGLYSTELIYTYGLRI